MQEEEEEPAFLGYRKLALLLKNKKADSNANVHCLRDALSNLHYDTRECSYCGWVDHEDELAKQECLECNGPLLICDDCVEGYIEPLDAYCCRECIKTKATAEEEDEKSKKRPAEEALIPEGEAKLAKLTDLNDSVEKEEEEEESAKQERKKRRKLERFHQWKNMVEGEPMDLVSVQRWDGWTEIDYCMVCKKGPFVSTYEVQLQWGDTEQREYVREMCSDCLHKLNKKYIRNKSPNY